MVCVFCRDKSHSRSLRGMHTPTFPAALNQTGSMRHTALKIYLPVMMSKSRFWREREKKTAANKQTNKQTMAKKNHLFSSCVCVLGPKGAASRRTHTPVASALCALCPIARASNLYCTCTKTKWERIESRSGVPVHAAYKSSKAHIKFGRALKF